MLDAKKGSGLILVFFTALVSGFSIFINKFGVAGIDSDIFTFSKNMIVALLIFGLILALREHRSLKSIKLKQWLQLSAIGLIGGAVPFILFFKALQLSSGASAAFIHKTMLIFVAILAVYFLKERLNYRFAIAAILLLAGNALLLKLSFAFNTMFNAASLLVLGATILWAVETIISKNLLKTISPRIVAFSRMFFGSLFILIYLAFTSKLQLISTITSSQLLWIILTAGFLFIYVTTWYTGLRSVSAITATQILLLGSPITTLLNYAFLGASMTLMESAGILLLVIAMILALTFNTENAAKLSPQHTRGV